MEERKEAEINKSLQAVNDELLVIKKDQQGYGYNFRGIDDVYNMVGPLLKKHGIITRRIVLEVVPIPDAVNAKGEKMNHFFIRSNYAFHSTKDGSEVLTWSVGEGLDKTDKGLACALSNSYKYAIWEFFNIATDDLLDSDQKTAKENAVGAPKKEAPAKKDSFRQKPVTSGDL